MEIVDLKANVRTVTGKKGARQCRQNGLLPGVLYGRGDTTTSLTVNPKELDRVLHTHAGSNVIIRLTLEEKGGDPTTVVVKELQVDSLKGTMRHVDFCHISLDKKIRTTVPFRIVGESPGVKLGGILEHTLWELEIESLPLEVPDYIEVDVSGLNMGDSLSVADLRLPEAIKVLTEQDVAVVSIAAPRVEAEVEAAPAPEAEVGEPEVITAKAEKKGEGAEEKEEPKAARKEEPKAAKEEKKPAEKRKSKE
ncbi:MAG: 50S ribosomal protein L25 [Candidatus Abyssobacteria bacterium SURF_17]|jgi:large subunit ribosomal protein L25|uniref:Large ribosomal subunit protein bL25 n=1 Tax=Candidatus Abyssobacteria bacterium SURF_17 TaxID=2093361 RepID=A0A419EZG3_9BACT|nr:MAG: 50S ribosomal protein L25 [Candidatus Abyssubacteria bacterium SURF_17]